MEQRKPPVPDCPCASGRAYATCCAPLHQGAPAASPEALMRSRYAAYVLKRTSYLLATWDRSTRPACLAWDEMPDQWLGLQILAAPAALADVGEVEFVARYRKNGRAGRLHERSRFVRRAGRWYYLDGSFLSA